jgi:hypothetical protein
LAFEGTTSASFLQKKLDTIACTVPAYPYCYDYTIVNQWACETCPGQMTPLCAANPDPNVIGHGDRAAIAFAARFPQNETA